MSENSFEVLDVPTCWTCHRGNAVPAAMPIPVPAASYDPGIFSSSREPARQVYENVQQYVTIPAEGLAEVMEGYSAALGVGCDYCHTPDFASDELVTKVLSRRMFEIQREVQAEFFEMGPDLTCWTCHQGAAVPELNLPPDLVPIP